MRKRNWVNKLFGSWKTQNVIDQSGQNASDKITFSKDSVNLEIFANKKLVERYAGKYSLDVKLKLITIQYPNQPKFKFEIVKLSEKEFIFKNLKSKAINKCVRY